MESTTEAVVRFLVVRCLFTEKIPLVQRNWRRRIGMDQNKKSDTFLSLPHYFLTQQAKSREQLRIKSVFSFPFSVSSLPFFLNN
jgi:hypothetical protein